MTFQNKKFAWKKAAQAISFVLMAGLIPLIALWNQNKDQVQPIVVLTPLWITLIFILVTGGIWLAITRSTEKGALLALLTFIFFFTFGHIYNLIAGKAFFGISIGYAKLLLVYLILFAVLAFLIFRIRRIPGRILLYMNILAGVLLLVNILPVLVNEIRLIKPAATPEVQPVAIQVSGSIERDIYYIVLDMYTREDILKSLFNYDDSAFYAALQERGFYIPECAFSNYEGTELTVASVLNYDYLQELSVSGKQVGQDLIEDPNRITDNKVRAYFKQYGYTFVAGRGYTPANNITNADIFLDYFVDNHGKDDLSQAKFLTLYLNTTTFRVLTELYNENPTRYSQLPFWLTKNLAAQSDLAEATFWYYQNNYIFDSVGKIPEKSGAYLVYAHINGPHGPYVYKSDGSFQYPMGNPLPVDLEKTLYTNELTYINKRALELVDTILKNSRVPPIIIIQGDHGVHNLTTGLDKHKILSAYYLPGQLISPPYPTITPVNDFRLIIKNYFDTSIQLSPDILYIKEPQDYISVPSSCSLKP